MIAAVDSMETLVLIALQSETRIVFHENSVAVRRCLVLLVYVDVFRL